ncbi:hypothetical protein C2845_PM06G23890 [Panicum miliaceum]|uniref:Uncharacterized protein n=1 Tax=Panicum miliaceum TaxID=4540 RepID=A0A3L6RE84_PANMI|nr:hypothetical protein C2845_PM06G23890 [Panicum miliaceum]
MGWRRGRARAAGAKYLADCGPAPGRFARWETSSGGAWAGAAEMGGPGAVHRRPPRQGAAHARRLLPVGCGAPRRPGRGLRPPCQARQAPRGDAEGDHHPQRHGGAAQRVHAAQPGARRAQRHRPRLGPPLRERLGDGFFADFARAADDESRHFRWYSQRFAELGFSHCTSLWRECARSSSDVSARLAVIPLVQVPHQYCFLLCDACPNKYLFNFS